MKNIVKKISAVILLILMCTISITSYAASEYSVKLKTDKTKYRAGDIIELVVSMEDITTDEGIALFNAIIDFDNSILELVGTRETEEWSESVLVENMVTATRKDMMNSKEDQEAAIITLRVKENVNSGKTNIGLSKVDATDGNKTMKNSGTSINIEILSEGQTNGQIAENNQNNIILYIIIAVIILAVIVSVVWIIIKKKSKSKNKN